MKKLSLANCLSDQWSAGLNWSLGSSTRENYQFATEFLPSSVTGELIKVRPVPDQELWFEIVWKKNLEDNLTES